MAAFRADIDEERLSASDLLKPLDGERATALEKNRDAGRADIAKAVRQTLAETSGQKSAAREALGHWLEAFDRTNDLRYNSTLYSDQADSALRVKSVPATYAVEPEMLDGRQILQRNFEAMFRRDSRVLTFGEDTGGIGVNQVMEGMRESLGMSA